MNTSRSDQCAVSPVRSADKGRGEAAATPRTCQDRWEAAREQMLREVEVADLVVTHPTLYAVALSWDALLGGLPMVVAKGNTRVAARIEETARLNHVPSVEDEFLAEMLFRGAKLGHPVPSELQSAVARVFSIAKSLVQHQEAPFSPRSAAPASAVAQAALVS